MTANFPVRDDIIRLITDKYNSINMSYSKVFENDLENLTRKYEQQVSHLNLHFSSFKLKSDTVFNLTLKKINALYDSYEITLGQIQAYINTNMSTIVNLLKENLDNIQNSIVETSSFTLDNSYICDTVKLNINTKSIKLAFDPDKLQFPLFTRDELSKAQGTVLQRLLSRKHVYYVNIVSANNTTSVYLNNMLCKDIQCCLIDELDIIILWESRNGQTKSSYVFIRISTGEQLYNLEEDTYHHSKIIFTYCNNTILCIMSLCFGFNIKPFYLDNFCFKFEHKWYRYFCPIKDLSEVLMYRNMRFFGDKRGLYIYLNDEIYLVGKLHILLNMDGAEAYGCNIPLTRKIKLNITGYTLLHILNIDYDNYLIYFVKKSLKDNDTNLPSVVFLSISDRQLLI